MYSSLSKDRGLNLTTVGTVEPGENWNMPMGFLEYVFLYLYEQHFMYTTSDDY